MASSINATFGEPCFGFSESESALTGNCLPCEFDHNCGEMEGCFPGMSANGTAPGCACHFFFGFGGVTSCEPF